VEELVNRNLLVSDTETLAPSLHAAAAALQRDYLITNLENKVQTTCEFANL
jgi:hypothetical protein